MKKLLYAAFFIFNILDSKEGMAVRTLRARMVKGKADSRMPLKANTNE
jgi:hypothetical protein